MSRKKIVAGNWKMNKTVAEGKQLVSELQQGLSSGTGDVHVIIAAPFLHLPTLIEQSKENNPLRFGAQNCHQEASGAFTGEISAAMLADAGVQYVILGHSERRQYFNEDEALLSKKIDTALAQGLKVIYCVGESLEVRELNEQNELVKSQLTALDHLSPDAMAEVVLAYEPVWAIGTGKTATSEQAQEMHRFIRNTIIEQFGKETADNTSILYGGSCNAQNAAELFAQPDIDGGLIGGASLKAPDFIAIIEAGKNA
ncbi:MAG: triose-phosphate isomerase [Taibaiella sp.]|nr:triose-phosphate isomerase [Taibaiella sp.]